MAKNRPALVLSGLGVAGIFGLAVLGVITAGPATGQVNQQPAAVVTADPTTGEVGTFILLDGTGSTDPDGTIVTYSWDFGDGTPSVAGSLAEAGQVFHSYGANGVYTVRLTVTDDQGANGDPAGSAATVTVTIGTVTTTTTTLPATTTTTQAGSVSGSQLYAANCAACHGASGAGGIGPSLQTSTFSTGATVSAVASGVGSMPGFSGSLSLAEIDAVSVYSVGLQSAAAPATTTTTQAMVVRDPGPGDGADAYAANCAACHGADGEGGIGPSLQASSFDLDATVEVIANGVGTMPGFSGGLSGEQITEVAVYSIAFQGGAVAEEDTGSPGEEPTGDLPTGEGTLAIQPSKYVEFDAEPSSVPLAAGVELGIALASMATLGLLVYWEVRRVRKADAASGGSATESFNPDNL